MLLIVTQLSREHWPRVWTEQSSSRCFEMPWPTLWASYLIQRWKKISLALSPGSTRLGLTWMIKMLTVISLAWCASGKWQSSWLETNFKGTWNKPIVLVRLQLGTDVGFGFTADIQMKAHSRLPQPVYQYLFSYISDAATVVPDWMGKAMRSRSQSSTARSLHARNLTFTIMYWCYVCRLPAHAGRAIRVGISLDSAEPWCS